MAPVLLVEHQAMIIFSAELTRHYKPAGQPIACGATPKAFSDPDIATWTTAVESTTDVSRVTCNKCCELIRNAVAWSEGSTQ